MACLSMIGGMFFFGITNAVAKGTGNDLPLTEIIFFRSLVASICMLGYARFQHTHNLLKTHHPKTQLFRATLGFFQLYFLYWSFAALPMADATALSFSTTLFVTALSVPFLREKVNAARWVATIVGFLAVIAISNPTGSLNIEGSIAAVISAFLEAMVMIYACRLGKQDKAFTTVFYYTLVTCLLGALTLPFVWVTPTFSQISLITLLGIAGTAGHILIARSYQLAPAAVVAPMFYTLLLWGIVFGYVFWQEIPSFYALSGAAVIIACGLFIVRQEQKEKSTHHYEEP